MSGSPRGFNWPPKSVDLDSVLGRASLDRMLQEELRLVQVHLRVFLKVAESRPLCSGINETYYRSVLRALEQPQMF